jgi:hypothetical protein
MVEFELMRQGSNLTAFGVPDTVWLGGKSRHAGCGSPHALLLQLSTCRF